MSGEVLALWLRPAARLSLRSVDVANAVAGVGFDGDHAKPGSRRQVTLLEAERWADACAALGRDVDPAARRANVFVRGVDLLAHRGRRLRLGAECVVEVLGETRPCELLDHTAPGLDAALREDGRGGAFGRVVVGGAVHVGDVVADDGPPRAD